jgi:hypothetical protein
MLQFPAMPSPMSVEVTPQQLYFLDRHAERQLAADGTAIYAQKQGMPQEYATIH